MSPDDPVTVMRALERFVAAINAPSDAALLAAAVTSEVRVDRHAPGSGVTEVAERFTGIAELARWLARTPPHVTFALVGEPWRDGEHTGIKYSITVEDFYNEGIWLVTIDLDELITFLAHRPFALRSAP